MRVQIKLLLLLALCCSTFSVQAEEVSDHSQIAKGAKLYGDNCGRCHNPRPASDYALEDWPVVMLHMRGKARMTGKEARAVTIFLTSSLKPDIAGTMLHPLVDARQRSGATLVAVYGCQGCHRLKGSGGNLGPSLDGIVASKGLDYVVQKLKNPTFNNASSAMPKFPLTATDMISIAEYIGSPLSLQKEG